MLLPEALRQRFWHQNHGTIASYVAVAWDEGLELQEWIFTVDPVLWTRLYIL